MSRPLALLALVLVAVPLNGQSPPPSTAPLQVPFRQFQLANGLNVSDGKIRHEAVAEALGLPFVAV